MLKGYSVRGVTGLDMPSNWMALHSSLSSVNVAFILDKAKAQTRKLLEKILSGKYYFNGICCLMVGLVLAPLSILYMALGRFWLSKLFFATNACTGCGVCVQNCPIGAGARNLDLIGRSPAKAVCAAWDIAQSMQWNQAIRWGRYSILLPRYLLQLGCSIKRQDFCQGPNGCRRIGHTM
jgi:ferredoxin